MQLVPLSQVKVERPAPEGVSVVVPVVEVIDPGVLLGLHDPLAILVKEYLVDVTLKRIDTI